MKAIIWTMCRQAERGWLKKHWFFLLSSRSHQQQTTKKAIHSWTLLLDFCRSYVYVRRTSPTQLLVPWKSFKHTTETDLLPYCSLFALSERTPINDWTLLLQLAILIIAMCADMKESQRRLSTVVTRRVSSSWARSSFILSSIGWYGLFGERERPRFYTTKTIVTPPVCLRYVVPWRQKKRRRTFYLVHFTTRDIVYTVVMV